MINCQSKLILNSQFSYNLYLSSADFFFGWGFVNQGPLQFVAKEDMSRGEGLIV